MSKMFFSKEQVINSVSWEVLVSLGILNEESSLKNLKKFKDNLLINMIKPILEKALTQIQPLRFKQEDICVEILEHLEKEIVKIEDNILHWRKLLVPIHNKLQKLLIFHLEILSEENKIHLKDILEKNSIEINFGKFTYKGLYEFAKDYTIFDVESEYFVGAEMQIKLLPKINDKILHINEENCLRKILLQQNIFHLD